MPPPGEVKLSAPSTRVAAWPLVHAVAAWAPADSVRPKARACSARQARVGNGVRVWFGGMDAFGVGDGVPKIVQAETFLAARKLTCVGFLHRIGALPLSRKRWMLWFLRWMLPLERVPGPGSYAAQGSESLALRAGRLTPGSAALYGARGRER